MNGNVIELNRNGGKQIILGWKQEMLEKAVRKKKTKIKNHTPYIMNI